uniref:Uncharacterized protein n=1 Tax=Panagrolaimus davidi TaxID=227884 RepID=A0A914P4T2_9BILA
MAAQANNPFIFNLLKQNQNIMNNLNNNNNNSQTPNNNNNNTTPSNTTPHINNNCISPSKVIDLQKKWQRQDRKQRELEIKLGLAIAAAQLPTALIKNPFFRDFVETAQPKFTMPLEINHIDELINSQYARTIIAVKMQLATAPKVSIIIDVLKLRTFDQENFENVENNDDFSEIKQLQKFSINGSCFTWNS